MSNYIGNIKSSSEIGKKKTQQDDREGRLKETVIYLRRSRSPGLGKCLHCC